MGDLLSTSVSGLMAFQTALDVTSNNISNAATPGYSVETPEFVPQLGQGTTTGYIGDGVSVETVTRTYSELLAQQVRAAQASYSNANALATQAAQVDNMLSSSSTGISSTLQGFVNAMQTLSTAPASTANRQVVLSQAQALVQQLQSYDAQLSQYGSQIEGQIGTDVNQINSLATSIASTNSQIAVAVASGQSPNTLLDQRDSLIDQLSQFASVSTVTQSDGTMNVYIGSGQALVNGGVAQQLATLPNPYNATENDIGLVTSGGTADVTTEINGGDLGGLLAARSQVIQPTQSALGQISLALASTVNQAQQTGMDLTGALGQPMFAVGGPLSAPSSNNTGTGSLAVTISNVAQVTTDNYQLRYSGGSYQLLDSTTGQSVALTGSGTSASPLQAAGLSIVVNGTPANGDSFSIEPTAGATAGLAVLLTNPNQIAAASPVQTAASASNTGTGAISAATVTDPTNAQLQSTATIQFLSPSTYEINGAGSYAYTAGSPIAANGWSVSISGAPATGDTFTVSANAGGTGDNSNLLAMIKGFQSGSLNGGVTSITGAASNLISQVGVLTQQAQATASSQQSVYQDAVTARSNNSGVNLDEEAAKMLQYQQAYQACAQLIQASNQMFSSLMSAITNG